MAPTRPTRKGLATSFPTLVQYVGLLLMVAVFVSALFGGVDAVTLAPLTIAAGGMIGFKYVQGAGEANGDGDAPDA